MSSVLSVSLFNPNHLRFEVNIYLYISKNIYFKYNTPMAETMSFYMTKVSQAMMLCK